MNRWKKLQALLLSIILVISMVPSVSVYAEDVIPAEAAEAVEAEDAETAIEAEAADTSDEGTETAADAESAPDEAETAGEEAADAEPDAADTADEAPEAAEEEANTESGEEEIRVEAETYTAAGDGKSVLAFTSDIHNSSGNVSAIRLGTWLDAMKNKYGHIDALASGGDMGNAGASSSTYWDLAQADMDQVSARNITGIYTTGNHEYSPGNYSSSSSSATQKVIKKNTVAAEGNNYRIYCLGSDSSSQSYSAAQITALTSYLSSVDNSKPIFIITHFPLHYYSGRSTSSADSVIDALNTAATNGTADTADDKKIIFLWGHNHTVSDTFYDDIYAPGSSIVYNRNGNEKTLRFYYGAAGCMSDSEYSGGAGVGSAYVKGKGLIVTVDDATDALDFHYYDANSNDVTQQIYYADGPVDPGTDEPDEPAVPDEPAAGKTYVLTDKMEAGKNYLIANTSSGSGYILSSENGSGSGSLNGYSITAADGKVTISADVEAKTLFTASGNSDDTVLLMNEGAYLYADSSGTLRMTSSVSSGKYWHYKAFDGTTDKHLLWFYNGTSGEYGYTATDKYKYYLNIDQNGNFTKGTAENSTVLASVDTPKIYLFVESDGSTPVDPVEPGETTTYRLATSLEAGKEYLIANGNSGSVYLVSTESNGARTLKGIAATVTDSKITITSDVAAKAVFTCDLENSSDADSTRLKNGSQHLYTDNSSGLRMFTLTSEQNGKHWHYKADGKNLLWFFNDAKGSDGYTDTSSTYKYYLVCNNGNYTDNHVSTTSLANTTTPAIYLFVKDDGTTPVTPDPVSVTGVTLDKTALSLTEGETAALTATVAPANADNQAVTWSSSNPAAATVANGVVTAVAAGSATITVTTVDGGFTATCNVTVTESVTSKYVLADSLAAGGEYLIVNTSAAGSAYALKNPGGSSGGTAIANSNNKTAVTIQTGDYIETSENDIIWTAAANGEGFNLTNNGDYLEGASGNVSIFNPQKYSDRYWTYNSNSQLQHKGGQSTYTLRYSSSNSYFQGSTSSSNSYRVYLFKKVDTTPAAVTGITVTPVEASVEVGGTVQLTANVIRGNASNKNVTWSSSNPAAATVANGVVTAVAAGTATITVTTVDGGFTASCEVTVAAAPVIPGKTYVLTDQLEPGKKYIIARYNTGTTPVLANSNNTVSSVDVTVVNNTISTNDESIVFEATGSGGTVDNIGNGGRYLYASSSSLTLSANASTGRPWSYGRTDSKLTCKSSRNTYYLYYSTGSSNFTVSTSATSSSPREVYLFVESDGTTPEVPASFTVEPVTGTYTYTGSAIAPAVTVQDGDQTLVLDTDYTVAYVNNINAGTASVTVSGKGDYADAEPVTVTFTIGKGIQAAPSVNHTDETVKGKKDGTITGVTSAMEYSTDGVAYAGIVGESLVNLQPGTYYVRMAETNNLNASEAAAVVITASTVQLTVSFQTNGGSAVAAQKLDYNGVPTRPEAPTKEGYTFTGWFADAAFETIFDFTARITADTTVYAKWTEIIPLTVTVSGTVTSFSNNDAVNPVTLTLTRSGASEPAYTATVTGNSAAYSIAGVTAGTYTLTVSKLYHAVRTYTVTVSDTDVTQDAEIRLMGDMNGDGKVTTIDFGIVNAAVKKQETGSKDAYWIACADVNEDGSVTTVDGARINSHARLASDLWPR